MNMEYDPDVPQIAQRDQNPTYFTNNHENNIEE